MMLSIGGAKTFFQRVHWQVHIVFLVVVVFTVFSNNYDHEFLLDSSSVIEKNPFVRSLLYIPQYFTDATILTTNKANSGYRPILQTTFAFNYWISGYDTWSWHLVQIILHAFCVIGLYLVASHLIETFEAKARSSTRQLVPLIVATLFAIHPYTSGVVNYIYARSSLLTAAFLIFSLLFYLRHISFRISTTRITYYLSLMFFTAALFTKVEAIAALAIFMFAEIMENAAFRIRGGNKVKSNFEIWSDLKSAFNKKVFNNLIFFLIAGGLYLVVWNMVVPDFLSTTRQQHNMTSWTYLLTQVTACWYYIYNWFVPNSLIAHNEVFPIIRSIWNPLFILAVAGWFAVIGVFGLSYQKRPYLAFLAISSLALISPTSSFLPLAEMVNEHRPYLPIALLSMTWLIPSLIYIFDKLDSKPWSKYLLISTVIIFVTALCGLTYERNLTYKTKESYYVDIIGKGGTGALTLNNYALIFMARGEYEEATSYFKKALIDAPNWHVIHNNLGIVYRQKNLADLSLKHFNLAVAEEHFSNTSLLYRGRHYLEANHYKKALVDFQQSLKFAVDTYPSNKGIATAQAGLGQWKQSWEFSKILFETDKTLFETDVSSIGQLFWKTKQFEAGLLYYSKALEYLPNNIAVLRNITALELGSDEPSAHDLVGTPEAFINLSMDYYHLQEYEQSIQASERALQIRPNYALAYNNICAGYIKLKKYSRAIDACTTAIAINPNMQRAKANLNVAKNKSE